MRQKEYFDLRMESLRILGGWAADCAERALSIYEDIEKEDARPRKAIEGIREFSLSGKRTNALRKLAMDAYRASRETENAPARAAAQSASLAAASAFTHPLRDARQAKHILGPAAYSALAKELALGGGEEAGNAEIERAAARADPEIAELLQNMPARERGKQRIDRLLYELDMMIRKRP
jgi:hypothetical protein